jgi:hypothetical protein
MSTDNVATEVADDDFDMTADLAAAFDAAEQDSPEPVIEPAEEQETEAQAAERIRDEKGRFAPKAATEDPAPEAKPADPVVAKEPVAAAAEQPVDPVEAVRPPPGWSPAAKVAFDALPPEVKQAVAQREQEVNKGFEKLAAYKPIDRFMEMARGSGTTLDRALENYVGMETKLREDFPGGVLALCQRQGIHPVALANHILARSGAAPSEVQAGETQQAHQTAPSVDPATAQRIAALEQHIQQQQNQGVQTEIERFASDPKHTFFENVKADMGRLINAGYATDLPDAYEKACWANQEIRGLLIKQQSAVPDTSAKAAAALQARSASKSITGSPIPKAGSRGPESSIEDDIRQLMEASV